MASNIKYSTTLVTQYQLPNTLNNLVKRGCDVHSIHKMFNDDFTIIYTEIKEPFKPDTEWLAKVKAEQANGK